MTGRRTDFHLGLLLLGLSGATALGHQVLWTRRLTDLVGATAESSTRVLSCFFLGMALGSGLVARLEGRIRRPWRALGWVELGVAFLAIPILALPSWTGWIWPTLGPERLVGWPGQLSRFVLSLVVTAAPALLIGMTLPLVVQAVREKGTTCAKCDAWLYSAYTLGGALGLAGVAGLALHRVGMGGSLLMMLGGNSVVAAISFCRDQFQPKGKVHLPAVKAASQSARVEPWHRRAPLLAFMSGCGMMALEVLALAELNLKMPLAFYTTAAILFCVVLLLGCSAAVVPWVFRLFGGMPRLLPPSLAAAGFMIAAAPVLFLGQTVGHASLFAHGSGIGTSLLRLVSVTCVSLGPAVLLAGVTFPLLLCESDSGGPRLTGRQMGFLLAMSGLGGMLGAEVATRFLLPRFGVHLGLGVLGAFYCLWSAASLLAFREKRILPWAVSLCCAAGSLWLLGAALPMLPIFLRRSTFQVLEVRSGAEGSLAVVERADLGRAMIFNNLYLLGSTRGVPDLERQAHVPLLLHPNPRKVGFAGLGTGISAAGALRHDAVEEITIVELSPLVASAARRHFRDFNQAVCQNPKAQVWVEDAGPYFASAKERFDVIVGDLFVPWRPGEARLCSLEQFQAAYNALRPGGVFCQWLAMSQLTEKEFEIILATFQRVFGQVSLFRNHFKTGSTPLALVGFKGSQLNWEIVDRRCRAERLHKRLGDPVCRFPESLALLYLGTCRPQADIANQLNSLGNLRVELGAGRHMLAGSPADYFHGDSERWLTFLQQQVDAIATCSTIPDALRDFPRAGLLATRRELALQEGNGSAPALLEALLSNLPKTMLTDSAADWSFWAGSPLWEPAVPRGE